MLAADRTHLEVGTQESWEIELLEALADRAAAAVWLIDYLNVTGTDPDVLVVHQADQEAEKHVGAD